MNEFRSTLKLIYRHGIDLTYTSVTRVQDFITGSVTTTKTPHTVKIYPKHIQANQYNYPNLIGKQVIMFYLANDSLPFTIGQNDTITYQGQVYTIYSYQSHVAKGELLLYRIMGVKG